MAKMENMPTVPINKSLKMAPAVSSPHPDPLTKRPVHQPEPPRKSTSILPLPPEVVAQITSSVVITTLTAVILGLVENSLDAQASRITVDVDFGRGGCVVEDNGLGILPREFGETGGMGKLHHTSKYSSSASTYGRDGVFLASLSALCLLSISSHHHLHRSVNSIAFHRAQVLSRDIPAPGSHHLSNRDHGTKVSVRNLFGDMPVRVKHRTIALEDRGEQDRQWDGLRNDLVGLVIASGRSISLRVKDAATSKTLTLLEPRSNFIVTRGSDQVSPSLSGSLRIALSMLGQAGFIPLDDTSSWIPASASSKTTVIRGAISLLPVPTKSIQFLSFGMRPLPRRAYNQLYDRINQLFARSRFGVVEGDLVMEEEKRRRLADKRFKQDGLTAKQKTIEKGVDRWPMFVLSVAIKKGDSYSAVADFSRSDAELKAVVDVLDALITGWLASHHFSAGSETQKKRDKTIGLVGEVSESEGVYPQERTSRTSSPSSTSLDPPDTSKRQDKDDYLRRPYTGITSFNELSRIKGGGRHLAGSTKQRHITARRPFTPQSGKAAGVPRIGRSMSGTASPSIEAVPLHPDQLSAPLRPKLRPASTAPGTQGEKDVGDKPQFWEHETNSCAADETTDWTDPITKITYEVNARTGAAVVPNKIPEVADEDGRCRDISERRVSLNKTKRVHSRGTESNGWLGNILQSWNSPVFPMSEKGITQISLEIPAALRSRAVPIQPQAKEIAKSFTEHSRMNASRLSKSALKNAQVIAQVDNKFILITMAASNDDDTDSSTNEVVLIAIDQHAADERCKVEDLLSDLCAKPRESGAVPTSTLKHKPAVQTVALSPPLIFSIQTREAEMFKAQEARFADWGILFGIEPVDTRIDSLDNTNLIVESVPPSIAERCKLEPKVLITLLRTELWKLAESNPTLSKNVNLGEDNEHLSEYPWLQRIGNCPQGILDMVDSRACRSAIMFNDPLSIQECKDLVQRLASCAFPFQCAHGRPSMVPLVGMGELGGSSADLPGGFGLGKAGLGKEYEQKPFRRAYVEWQHEKVGDS